MNLRIKNHSLLRDVIFITHVIITCLLIIISTFILKYPPKNIYGLKKNEITWPTTLYFCNLGLGVPITNIGISANWTYQNFSCTNEQIVSNYCCIAVSGLKSIKTLGANLDVCSSCYSNQSIIQPGIAIHFDNPCKNNILGFASQGFYNAMVFNKQEFEDKIQYTLFSTGVIAMINTQNRLPQIVSVSITTMSSSTFLEQESIFENFRSGDWLIITFIFLYAFSLSIILLSFYIYN